MKRIGYLYEKICSRENVALAFYNALRHKTKQRREMPQIKNIADNREHYIDRVCEMLTAQAYKASPYTEATVIDGITKKQRTIHKPRFYPDQIVHWAVMQVVGPVLYRGQYFYNCGSIVGRGGIFAAKSVESWVQRTDIPGTKYCLKVDVHHFYQSIDHTLLKAKYRRLIKDARCLQLLDEIVDSFPDSVPIGNYTSQFFGNLFLSSFDHHIAEECKSAYKVTHYARYMDDVVVFGTNKRKLHRLLDEMQRYLAEEKLQLNGKSQVFPVDARRVDFCGYAIGRTNTRIRKKIALRIMRNCRALAAGKYTLKRCRRFASHWGWVKHTDSTAFAATYIHGKIDRKRIKEVIRNANQ